MVQTLSETGLLREKTATRYLSLDVLRGITLALMVIVNSPGSWDAVYGPLRHAPWHGFTLTDWVFPSFLFVVGNAMSFTMKKFENQDAKVFLAKVFKRTALIFLIGLFLNAYPFFKVTDTGTYTFIDFASLRIVGVLQRIALCYCIASLVIYYLGTKGALWFSLIALLGYWAILYVFGDPADPYSIGGNAVTKLDLLIIGPQHMYKGEGIPFEPEGILSTLPAVVNVIGGYLAGQYLQQKGNLKSTILKLIVAGIILVAAAWVWDIFFPINKKIWTSSYVLVTVGLNILAIAALMNVIEIANVRRWTWFFEIFGKNPLILYALSGMIVKTMFLILIDGHNLKAWLYNTVFLRIADPINASLLYALSYMMLIWIIGYFMDRKGVYVRV